MFKFWSQYDVAKAIKIGLLDDHIRKDQSALVQTTPAEATETRERFKISEIGSVHIDGRELRHADGSPIVVPAIDCVSRFTYVDVATERASWKALFS